MIKIGLTLPKNLLVSTQVSERLTITKVEASEAPEPFTVSFHRGQWKAVFARMNFSLLPIRDRFKNREYKKWKNRNI